MSVEVVEGVVMECGWLWMTGLLVLSVLFDGLIHRGIVQEYSMTVLKTVCLIVCYQLPECQPTVKSLSFHFHSC